MRLYPKKLRTIEDLEREKQLVIRERRLLEKEDMLSIDGILGKKGAKEDGEKEGSMLDLLSLLPISNPLMSIAVKAAQSWFSRKSDRTGPVDTPYHDRDKKKKHPLRTVAVEVIGGYLKWKAIELSFKGIRHVIKKRKENKQQE